MVQIFEGGNSKSPNPSLRLHHAIADTLRAETGRQASGAPCLVVSAYSKVAGIPLFQAGGRTLE